ncbi:MAG TPA: ECF-type sigma factor [Thermoanaerobaculia bacterium]|nr:ECF-type sigma factor [Thermoanaerobaculia bacterium]
MSGTKGTEVTRVLEAAARGDSDSAERLLPLVYDELRRLARARMARLGPGQTLTPTELVHEAYLRVTGGKQDSFEGRRHFFFTVSRAMRDLIVEGARRRGSLKRGGNYLRLPVEIAELTVADPTENVLDLDYALRKLEHESPDRAQVVQLSYFGGLTHPEIAEILGLSRATVERRWNYARIWLRRELSQPPPPRRE